MKKIIFLLSAIFIISNVVWGFMYFKRIDPPSNIVVQVYNLNGTGEVWDITDYKIIVSPNKILRGHGKLAYKGDPKNVENSTYYKFEIKKINPYGKDETVFVNEASSEAGPVGLLDNLDDIGLHGTIMKASSILKQSIFI
ncbi:hypothetical protein EHV15_01145 [Paenibacillus oralis]|uniref:Uncharacterized protein n=1 Tax=Paenibacillus oralis TaxID=2490856 RepID=A0A3P3TVG1_9BACL|nr:hypothetical protein [Paenibacillus oralis]RRJ61734.1 hypothetical protein EHV15_01145 [Paenibacillus oralis]